VAADLLFEPSLGIDPLRLFEQLSNYRTVVIAWPGTWNGTTLCYAETVHRHYRCWQQPRAIIEVVGI
jgi:hypothetical protein